MLGIAGAVGEGDWGGAVLPSARFGSLTKTGVDQKCWEGARAARSTLLATAYSTAS